MTRTLRFLLALLAGLAVLTLAGAAVVQKTTRQWFDEDIALRVRLIATGAGSALLQRWSEPDKAPLQQLLSDIARDERIMAAAACGPDTALLARTASFPVGLSCSQIAERMRASAAAGHGRKATDDPWSMEWAMSEGDVQVSAMPLVRDNQPTGFLVLIHDLSYIERREAKTRKFVIIGFGILAVSAAFITIIAAHMSRRGFRTELRRFILGKSHNKDFLPLVRDVRELVDRIAAEREMDGQGGAWSPQRLKQTLVRHFPGERVIVLANREPYIHQRQPDGSIKVMHPASGLVTAVEPVLRACSGVWIGHGSGSADRDVVDREDHIRVPPGEDSYDLRRVWLTPDEERGYYYGLSNEGLWPLCHLAHARPIFRSEDWDAYVAVNRRFADAVCKEASGDDPVVLVQDYHFALAPRFIRERLPRAVIITFWHIPWPNSERFGIFPWRAEILEGLLGSSIVGFHTQLHCNNFVDSVDRYLEARIDRESMAVIQHGRPALVRAYPISLEWPCQWVASAPPVAECRKSVFAELGLAPDALLGVGVDRLDYTKGIEERMLAVERMLERFPDYRGRFSFVQLAAPSRSKIERYQQLDEAVEKLTERINAKFGNAGYRPIILLRAHHEPPTVFRYYRAADFCYVSALHDGMNLVAKEFVAAREDERGVLLLSQFAGAAREMPEALIVNPYNMEEASAAMVRALTMSADDQQGRMRAMRAFLAEFNVYRWAGRMLMDASRIRRRASVLGHLDDDILGLANVSRFRPS
jgi:trehalose 6-phosphate synthase